MRAILSKKGIELVNELDGGIEVSGKKINLKGKNVTVIAEKSLSMNSDGPANFKEKGLSKKKWGSPNYFKFTREFKSAKI